MTLALHLPPGPVKIGGRSLYANVYLLETPAGRLMVDAGPLPYAPGFARLLCTFKPGALLLTHHHVDHAGGAFIAARLGIPILVHPDEHALLRGQEHRPPSPASRLALGGVISRLQPKVPGSALHPVLSGERVQGWEVIHLPGHTSR